MHVLLIDKSIKTGKGRKMLQIKNISKQYRTGSLVQKALNDVSLNLRDNEFVSILGPSGSGKTTLLNIIGGLDRYDSGDLVINGTSTKKYKDRDWDAYRNHTIGFVFQSYNLIPHQNILSNVELALTIGGVSKGERRKRAKQALEEVGLGDQIHKRPNQLSGGQMQRVAIARALVNDPDILLADEPTGALDTETSIQVMDLLKNVAEKRLVVMVTHNPELAEQYSTRIVRLRDGKIIDDSDPFEVTADTKTTGARVGKSGMSFATSIALSFNNLRTKKGRTILTAFAGSIGIIGIALILSLSTGVNQYIEDIQKDTMSSYPITISETTIDLSSMLNMSDDSEDEDAERSGLKLTDSTDENKIHASTLELQIVDTMSSSFTENDLTAFKHYLDDPDSEIYQYVGENGIVYSYDTSFSVYAYDETGKLINTDADTEINNISDDDSSPFSLIMQNGQNMMSMASLMGYGTSNEAANFSELMLSSDGETISAVITDNYDLLYGSWPTAYDEVVLVATRRGGIDASVLYQLGYLTASEYTDLVNAVNDGEDPDEIMWDYADMCDKSFYLVPACDNYTENEDGTFSMINVEGLSESEFKEKAIELKVVGVIAPNEDADNVTIQTAVAYSALLTDYVIEHTDESAVVRAQESDETVNVLNGMKFEAAGDEEKAEDAKEYIAELGVSDKASLYQLIQYYKMSTVSATAQSDVSADDAENMTGDEAAAYAAAMASGSGDESVDYSAMAGMTEEEIAAYMSGAGDDSGSAASAYSAYSQGALDESTMAQLLDEWLNADPDTEILVSLYDTYIKGSSYESNMEAFGKVSYDAPVSINIYTDSFEAKDGISESIDNYNASVSDESRITYTDYVALLTSSITTIINAISYVLIAFVAVSLVVSSIMIGIITNISVLERTKEIGILRALGASKRNVGNVFNAETGIVGFIAGLLGVVISWLLTIPINAVIHSLVGNTTINATLPLTAAVVLVIISVVITFIGGLIPAKKAARQDPVTALRTE